MKEVKDVDLFDFLKIILIRRRFIFIITSVFVVLGIIISVISPKEYTVTTTMIPQVKENELSLGGNLGGLASFAGINLNGQGTGDNISPDLYPQIMSSITFQKQLLSTEISPNSYGKKIIYMDYERTHKRFSLINYFKKISGKISDFVFGDSEAKDSIEEHKGLTRVSLEENEMIETLGERYRLTVDSKTGVIKLRMSMPEAIMAAEMAVNAQELLQNAITDFRIKRAQEQLDFTRKLHEEKRIEFEEIQRELSFFQDRNFNISTSTAKNELERLESKYELSLSIFSELSKQLETARLNVKENTPSFSILQPVIVPLERSSPRRTLIVISMALLGITIGACIIFLEPFIHSLKTT